MILVPLSTDPLFSQVTTLTGRDYIFTFAWNIRDSSWYVDIADQDGVPLATSRRVVVDFPLLPRRTNPALPAGLLIAIDTSGAGLDAGMTDFGTRVVLAYLEPDEIPTP